MDKIRICDLKLSSKLFHLKLLTVTDFHDKEILFYKDLAAGQINMEFLSRTFIDGKHQTSCCIKSVFHNQVITPLNSHVLLKDHTEIIPSVGLISLFPHRFSLEILGQSLNAFGCARLPIYGFASSISSITFITDYDRLKEAEETLKGYPFTIHEGCVEQPQQHHC